MTHFVRVVMEKQEGLNGLNESVFPEQTIFETEQGASVIEIPLVRELNEEEADEYANHLANMLFAEGYEDFDIEVSTDSEDLDEETYNNDDDFFAEYGVLGFVEDDAMWEAEYQGRDVKLNKPMQGDVKKFKVYVKDPKTGNVKKVNFGDPDSRIKKSNPERRRSFRARHNCDNPGPKTKARYWSCRKW